MLEDPIMGFWTRFESFKLGTRPSSAALPKPTQTNPNPCLSLTKTDPIRPKPRPCFLPLSLISSLLLLVVADRGVTRSDERSPAHRHRHLLPVLSLSSQWWSGSSAKGAAPVQRWPAAAPHVYDSGQPPASLDPPLSPPPLWCWVIREGWRKLAGDPPSCDFGGEREGAWPPFDIFFFFCLLPAHSTNFASLISNPIPQILTRIDDTTLCRLFDSKYVKVQFNKSRKLILRLTT